jgi:hypothetical protein
MHRSEVIAIWNKYFHFFKGDVTSEKEMRSWVGACSRAAQASAVRAAICFSQKRILFVVGLLTASFQSNERSRISSVGPYMLVHRIYTCCQPITGMSNIFRKNLHNLLTYCNSITSPLPYKTRNLISSPLQNSSNNLIGWFYIVVLPRWRVG